MTIERVAVIGGSIAGLTAALALLDVGFDVDVYERSGELLSGTGAGIVVHEETVRYLQEHTDLGLDDISVASSAFRVLSRSGAVDHEEPCPYRFTAWKTLYLALAGALGAEHYHRGHSLKQFEESGRAVELHFQDAPRRTADTVVAADGISSTVRRALLPDVAPVYSGYVGWRGTVAESVLSERSHRELADAITWSLCEGGHIVAYPIPGASGELAPGKRRLNYVWYRNLSEGTQLQQLMIDREGVSRPLSVGPGDVRQEFVTQLRTAAAELLAPPLAELVIRSEQPFVQVIVDVEVPRMVFDRVVMIGDAAFTARPHAAAGSAKAAYNARTLAGALRAFSDGDAGALDSWELEQLAVGRNLVARSRDIGERAQFGGTWTPDDPNLRFGLFEAGR